MAKPYEDYCLEWAVEDWWDTNIERIKKVLSYDGWISEFEDTVHGKSRYLQKAVSNALATRKYNWDTYDIINNYTQNEITQIIANLAYKELVMDDNWYKTKFDSFDES